MGPSAGPDTRLSALEGSQPQESVMSTRPKWVGFLGGSDGGTNRMVGDRFLRETGRTFSTKDLQGSSGEFRQSWQ